MDEARFWELLERSRAADGEATCHRLYLRLRKGTVEDVLAFEDRLAEVLHRMDLRVVAKQRWRDVSTPWWLPPVPGISADGFLYARCAAVLEGRETVERVVAEPRAFKRRWDLDAERLLTVGPDAYEGLTGRDLREDHTTPVSYETGSNPAGGWQREGYPPGNSQ